MEKNEKMKKLVVLAVIILALSASVAMAVSNHWSVNLKTDAGITTSNFKDEILTYGLYQFQWDGTWGITGTGNGANYIKGAIEDVSGSQVVHATPVATDWLYKFFYSTDAGATWIQIGALFQDTIYSGTTIKTGYTSGGTVSGVYANRMGILYAANVGTTSLDSANGLLSMTAKQAIVPEPSSFVGLGTALMLAGPKMFGWFRRRRA